MTTWVVLIALVAAFIVGVFLKPFWESFSQELGAAAAKGLVQSGEGRKARRRAVRRNARADRAAIEALTTGRPHRLPAPATESADELPLLAPGLRLSPGPLASGTATVIWVGTDAQERAQAAVLAGVRAAAHRAVPAGGHRLGEETAAFGTGALPDRLLTALAEADRDIAQGRATYVALVVRPPLTGEYAADRQLDLDAVFGGVLAGRDAWLTWLSPVDTSQWGEHAYLGGPAGPAAVKRELTALGFAFSLPPAQVGDALRLASADAGRALLALAGESAGHLVDADGQAPRYALRAAAVVSRAALEEGRARLLADGLPGLGSIAKGKGYSLRYESGDGLHEIDLDDVARQFTGYAVPPRPRPLTAAPPTDTSRLRLDEAVREGDGPLAASALIREGRAWLEADDAAERMTTVHAALLRFGRESEAGAWAHYLLVLERALRLRDVPCDAFDDRTSVARFGIADLYEAEAMEFARLRGEMDLACRLAEPLMPRLAAQDDIRSDAGRYARGTSRFLVANLLRNGGLYREAESWVRAAQATLDETRPAQESELLHCRYALGVCAAMAGRVLLQPLDARNPRANVFASALVELSNSHAAWLERDLARAVLTAERAQALFARIGYDRYARRAEELTVLLVAWQRRSAGGRPEELPGLLPRLVAGDVSQPPVDLSDQRPSRALGLLQFALRFRVDEHSPPVLLPSVLVAENGRLARRPLQPTRSVVEADRVLRLALGVPPGADVPLLAD